MPSKPDITSRNISIWNVCWVGNFPSMSTGIYWELSNKHLIWLYLFCLQVHVEFPLLAHWDPIATSDLHLLGPSNSFWTCSSLFVHRRSLHRDTGGGQVPFTFLRRLHKYKTHFHKTVLREVSLTTLAVWWRNWDTDALSKTGRPLGLRR